MPQKKRNTRKASSTTLNQQSLLSNSTMQSPIAASSPQAESNRFQNFKKKMITNDIEEKYSYMFEKLENFKSTMMALVEDDMMDTIYSSIYDKIETEHSTLTRNFLEAITGKQDKVYYEEEIEIKKPKRVAQFKKARRSKSEERDKKPNESMRRSRSRNHLDVPSIINNKTYCILGKGNVTYIMDGTQKSIIHTPIIRGSSYQIANVTPTHKKPTIFRKPLAGEHVISMSGSPILVSNDCNQNEAQIQIKGKDGKVYAIEAECSENITNFPGVDEKTLSEIRKLQKFLNEQVHD